MSIHRMEIVSGTRSRAFRAACKRLSLRQIFTKPYTPIISKVGDSMVRTALYEASHIMLTRVSRFTALKRWAMEVAKGAA